MLFIKSSRPRSPNSLPRSSERLDLARRLHDGLAQELAALGYAMDAIIGDPKLANEHRSELRSLRLRLIDINANFRDEIYLLRHQTFASLKPDLEELFSDTEVQIELPDGQLATPVEDAVARALLEIGRNSAQHSLCKTFSVVSQEIEGLIEITAADNGNGAISIRERSFGLASITEHLAAVGAEVEATSDQTGTRYTIRISVKSGGK